LPSSFFPFCTPLCQIVKSTLLLLYFWLSCQVQVSCLPTLLGQIAKSTLPKLTFPVFQNWWVDAWPNTEHATQDTHNSQGRLKVQLQALLPLRAFFFFNFVMQLKWQSSKRWFSQIWLQTRYENRKKSKSFYILTGTYHKNLAIWKPLIFQNLANLGHFLSHWKSLV
jgi:hypothetical protein